MIALTSLVVILLTKANAETLRTAVIVDGVKIRDDVVIDREKGLVTVNVGSVSKIPDAHSTINLHDFKNGVLTIKSVDLGECVLTKETETLSEVMMALDRYQRFHQPHVVTNFRFLKRVPITTVEALAYGGSNAVQFCEGYKLFKGNDVPQDNGSSKKRASCFYRSICIVCGSCLY